MRPGKVVLVGISDCLTVWIGEGRTCATSKLLETEKMCSYTGNLSYIRALSYELNWKHNVCVFPSKNVCITKRNFTKTDRVQDIIHGYISRNSQYSSLLECLSFHIISRMFYKGAVCINNANLHAKFPSLFQVPLVAAFWNFMTARLSDSLREVSLKYGTKIKSHSFNRLSYIVSIYLNMNSKKTLKWTVVIFNLREVLLY